tara:strand:+ start:2627 stop:3133 length:507 start_codon:yes stop_codon:yes gene_type:complete
MTESAAEWIDIKKLKPWKDNPRNNDGIPVQKVADSIERFGFAAPIIARKSGEIIAGHTRWKAAKQLGIEKVPVRYMDLTAKEAHLLAVADNRLGELAAWEYQTLYNILKGHSDADISAVGFSKADMDAWTKGLEEFETKTEGALEISEDSFQEFEHECPRCGFGFNGK